MYVNISIVHNVTRSIVVPEGESRSYVAVPQSVGEEPFSYYFGVLEEVTVLCDVGEGATFHASNPQMGITRFLMVICNTSHLYSRCVVSSKGVSFPVLNPGMGVVRLKVLRG